MGDSVFTTAVKEVLLESTLNRVSDFVVNYECATISAWRNEYANITKDTFKPRHITHNKANRGKKILGGYFQEGEDFTTEEKKYYNRELKACLLKLGYGVTDIRGAYKEFGKTDEQEESFLVVNLKGDENFKKNIFKLSEYYNQDSFMYSPKGSSEGILIGTNGADFPGYGNEIPSGKFTRGVQSLFMSRIGNKGFSFTNGTKVGKDNPNREELLGDYSANNYETDEPRTFTDRKAERVGKLLQLETYDKYSINGKRAICTFSAPLKNLV